MSHHVHLRINPGPKAANLAVLMKRVAGRQTRDVNARDRRTGTLWEGR
jgi:putative transposase